MLQKGPLELLDQPGPGFYSRLFLVQKATGLEVRHRPVDPGWVCLPDQVQDGDCGVSLGVDQDGQFDVLCRPKGRLLSNPHSSRFSALSPVCGGGSGVLVSGSLFGPGNSYSCVHQSLLPDIGVDSSAGDLPPLVSGRLVGCSGVSFPSPSPLSPARVVLRTGRSQT